MKTLPRPVAATPATATAGTTAQPPVQAPAQASVHAPVQPVAAGHLQDPVLARALFAAWSGDRAVVIASPPGAGKTRRVTQLADQLTRRAGLAVAVAAQTRAQALDVTSRIAALGCPVTLIGKARTPRPDGLHPAATWLTAESGLRTTRGVVVATTARWRYLDPALYRADVLVVEEAWQSTFADFGALGGLAGQFVMVGDPGQIDPVVTGDTTRWDRWDTGPQRPAPEAFTAAFPGVATELRLDTTWRLGPVTTALIQPAFYPDLPFTSARPPRHITLDGTSLPELAATALDLPGGTSDPALARAAAGLARDLLRGGTLHPHDGPARPLTEQDIAVIAPHVDQATAVAARLTDLPGVLVGTINQVQGSEREAVIAVHPLAGHRDLAAHTAGTGRLCVALSRHRCHAHVLTDTATPAVLRAALTADPGSADLAAHQDVLAALTAIR